MNFALRLAPIVQDTGTRNGRLKTTVPVFFIDVVREEFAGKVEFPRMI
jgi:hypothetical protein